MTFTEDEITTRLFGELAHWTYSDGAIRRLYKTHGWKSTLMVVNAIGHLSEAAWHHPDMEVYYDRVCVALTTHDANGITERDFTLAEVYSADEAFVTGTLGGVTPVTRVDGRPIGDGRPGAQTQRAGELYLRSVTGLTA